MSIQDAYVEIDKWAYVKRQNLKWWSTNEVRLANIEFEQVKTTQEAEETKHGLNEGVNKSMAESGP